MVDAHAEDFVIDRGQLEQHRSLLARKPNRALVRANAQVLLARSRALREAKYYEKHEKHGQRHQELQAGKDEERRAKADRFEDRLSHINSALERRQQALDRKAARDSERHAARHETLQSNKEIEHSMRSVMAKERDEKGGIARARADSIADKRRAALLANHTYFDQRVEAFKEQTPSIRSRVVEASREREVAKAEELAQHKERLDRMRERKEAAWSNKLERVTVRQHAQQLARQDLRRYNMEMERKMEQLNEITERLAAPGGIENKQLHAELHALRQELQDMSEAVPTPVPGLGSIVDPGLPRYMQKERRPPSAEPPLCAARKDACDEQPDDDMFSPGNASTRAPTSAPGSPAIGVRIMPGQ